MNFEDQILTQRLGIVFGGRGVRRFPSELKPGRLKGPIVPPVAGYTSWYDAADLSSFTLVGGSMVSQWNDKGSGGNNLVQATALSRPVIAINASIFNGLPAVYFGATSSTAFMSLTSSASTSDITQTAFFIAMLETLAQPLAAGGGTLIGTSSDGGNCFRVNNTTGQLDTSKADTATLGTQSNASVTAGIPFLAVQVLSATDVTHILNGTSETDAHAQTFTAGRTLHIGCSPTVSTGQPLRGWIGEILIYDTTLNSTDIGLVSGYLRSKWGF